MKQEVVIYKGSPDDFEDFCKAHLGQEIYYVRDGFIYCYNHPWYMRLWRWVRRMVGRRKRSGTVPEVIDHLLTMEVDDDTTAVESELGYMSNLR